MLASSMRSVVSEASGREQRCNQSSLTIAYLVMTIPASYIGENKYQGLQLYRDAKAG